MTYFIEVTEYQTYANSDADFHFSYNANSGGGQSFLGGMFSNDKGELSSPAVLDGYVGIFKFVYKNSKGKETGVLLDDINGKYEIKPRGTGSTSMKLSVGTKLESPSKLISSFFMLPSTCAIKNPVNLDVSILSSNNFWLQSMWLKCDISDVSKLVYLMPKDFVFCGGCNKDKQGKDRYFKLEAEKRILDIISLSEKVERLPKEIGRYISLFSDIYLGKASFNYDGCINATKQIMILLAKEYPAEYSGIEDPLPFLKSLMAKLSIRNKKNDASFSRKYNDYLTTLRTKPFLLLAGISGTGKSQKVQELAYMTCPDGELRNENGTAPGNYCLVEVKPNWHDSTELLGYYSALSGRYELTDFIRFVYKAIKNESVPFFLCLDEMNLAPVEQYFAEYLSVLETRKNVGGRIQTQPLLKKEVFANCKLSKDAEEEANEGYTSDGNSYKKESLYSGKDAEIIAYLKDNGLSLPENLFVIGTVNMDDTTHQFSRKVIDRAFTIEMNGGNMADMFSDESKALLEYRNKEDVVPLDTFRPKFVRAYEVLDNEQFAKYADTIKTIIPELLGNSDGTADEDSINGVLNNTPFRVSYRVQNELVLYISVLIEQAGFPEEIDSLIGEAVLATLLEKVLPRVQGEQKQLATKNGSNVLKDLKAFVSKHFAPAEGETNALYQKVVSKLDEMNEKLDNYYTNFF